MLSPTSGANLTNEFITARVRATDNVGVSDVQFSLNGGDFSSGEPDPIATDVWTMDFILELGPSTLQVLCYDDGGNVSATNTIRFSYVVLAPIGVQTIGPGTVTPNYNNQMLAIGNSYAMTARPATGCAFVNWVISTNWAGGTTNTSAMLNFVMQTNLTLQASFVDTSKPVLAITAPTANQRWSNAVFTVRGTAKDNLQVTEVWCQTNGVWGPATIGSAGTNWTVDVALMPGTNTVRAYAVDATGNRSLTNSVSFVYVLSDRLQVRAVGQGTLTPNYSNAVLEIGKSYSMKASGLNGHAFTNWVVSTNWVDGVTTNNGTLSFIMQSNLTLQASFVDTNRPVLAITAPTANQRWSNAVFTVRGTAKDNVQVTEVWCQTNGVWGPASVGSAGTNWTMDVALVPGANTVRACAVDGAGNRSLTNSVSFVYVLSDRLAVRATGPCTMSPNYSNAVLEIGKTYSTTVTPGTGFVLSNWTGTAQGSLVLVSNAAKLTFNMQSNLVLQANVIANPFTPAKGTYNGLFTPGIRAQDNSGFFTLTLSDSGSYSASLKCGTSTYPFTGQFDVAGQSGKVVLRPGTNAWVVAMQLQFAVQEVWGAVSNGVIGGWVAELRADRAVFDARTNPATRFAGSYTLNIPGGTNSDGTVRLGDSYLTPVVDAGGKMTYSGWLADGTAVGPISVPVSGGGHAPVYVPLYSGKGSLLGWLGLDDGQPATGMAGLLSWIRPAVAGGYYPAGLTNEVWSAGARYKAPTNTTTRVIEMTNGVVIFEGGNLGVPLTNAVMMTITNKVMDLSLSNKLSLSLTVSNGAFAGSVTQPGLTRSNLFKGVLLQDENSGYGYFLGTNRSGRVRFGPVR